MYTVKQLADLAQVSVRTLHYYDEIGLLRPAQIGANGYRYYDAAALLRLQQILLYRELGLELTQIKPILDSPHFDLQAALRAHREALLKKIARLENLVVTVDSTLSHVQGETSMADKQFFEAFSEEQQADYTRQARLQYDPSLVDESVRRWKNYSKARQEEIMAEGGTLYTEFVSAMEAGKSAQSAEVQALMVRWHQGIRHFYEPTLEILRGLGSLYVEDPRFRARFESLHTALPDFLQSAINEYVDVLETAEIERMLADDESARREQD